jgi:hypothetical protein
MKKKLALIIPLGIISILLISLLVIYLLNLSKGTSYDVVVSNTTNVSTNVSWYTAEPTFGCVMYSEKTDKFAFPKFACDHRFKADMDILESEGLSGFDLFTQKVKAFFEYKYINHYVTIPSLDSGKEYSFTILNDCILSKDVEEVSETLAEYTINPEDMSFATNNIEITEVGTPSPAFGTVYALAYDEEGILIEAEDKDAIVYGIAQDGGLLSAVTNSTGGWTMDRTNFRDEDGEPILTEGDEWKVCGRYEANDVECKDLVVGLNDEPVDGIDGNSEEDIERPVNSLLENPLVKGVSADRVADCAAGGGVGTCEPYSCTQCAFVCSNGPNQVGGCDTCSFPSSCHNSSTAATYGLEQTPDGRYSKPDPGPKPEKIISVPTLPTETTVVNPGDRTVETDTGTGGPINITTKMSGWKISTNTSGACSGITYGIWDINKYEIEEDLTVAKEACKCGSPLQRVSSKAHVCTNPLTKEDDKQEIEEKLEDYNNDTATDIRPPISCYTVRKNPATGKCLGLVRHKRKTCPSSEYESITAASKACGCDGEIYEAKFSNFLSCKALFAVETEEEKNGEKNVNVSLNPDIALSYGNAVAETVAETALNGFFDLGRTITGGVDNVLGSIVNFNLVDEESSNGVQISINDKDIIDTEKVKDGISKFVRFASTPLKPLYVWNKMGNQAVETICQTDNSTSDESVQDQDCQFNIRYFELENNDDTNSFMKKFAKGTYAQETEGEEEGEESQFIYYIPEDGFYNVSIEGTEYAVSAGEGSGFAFYQEVNGVEGYQETGENPDVLLRDLNIVQISYEKKTDLHEIELNDGINIVSFDHILGYEATDPFTAKELVEKLNFGGCEINSFTTYRAGGWEGGIYTRGTDYSNYSGTDFDLHPGRGYLINTDKTCTVQVPAYKVTDGVPLEYSSGWNLVGVHGYAQSFTAKSLIESVNGVSGLTADNVTWWPTSKGMYEGLQITDGQEYGFDFPIRSTNGYFVRIADFEPEDETCKSLIWHPNGDLHGNCGEQ